MPLTVKDLMHGITLVDADTTVAEAAKVMISARTTITGEIGSVLVRSGDKPIGIVTERDILKKIVAAGLDPRMVKVSQIMSTPLITISADTPVEEASRIMTENQIRRLPVTEEDRIIGIVTTRNLVRGMSINFIERLRKRRYLSERTHYTKLP